MPTRNPASVFPDPVGAAIRVSTPAAMWAQPSAWGRVGPSGNRRRNHSATAGWKAPSASEAARRDPQRHLATGHESSHVPILARGWDNDPSHRGSWAGQGQGREVTRP